MNKVHPPFWMPDNVAEFLNWLLVKKTVEKGSKTDKAELIREIIQTHPEYKKWEAEK